VDFVAIDVETANADRASICQVGIVGFRDGRVVLCWSRYVNPGERFERVNVGVHGITAETVKQAPTFPELVEEIRELIEGRVVVSHTSFDRVALLRATEKHGLPEFECRWLDSARVARKAWPRYARSGFGLANVAKDLGIEFRHHDAAEDARAAGEILLRAVAETSIPVDGWVGGGMSTIAEAAAASGRSLSELVADPKVRSQALTTAKGVAKWAKKNGLLGRGVPFKSSAAKLSTGVARKALKRHPTKATAKGLAVAKKIAPFIGPQAKVVLAAGAVACVATGTVVAARWAYRKGYFGGRPKKAKSIGLPTPATSSPASVEPVQDAAVPPDVQVRPREGMGSKFTTPLNGFKALKRGVQGAINTGVQGVTSVVRGRDAGADVPEGQDANAATPTHEPELPPEYPKVVRQGGELFLLVREGRGYKLSDDPVKFLGLVRNLTRKSWADSRFLCYAIERVSTAQGWNMYGSVRGTS